MNVHTRNSIYQVLGKGSRIEVKKISGRDGDNPLIAVNDTFVGVRIELCVGAGMYLYDSTGDTKLSTTNVIKIEG